MFNSTTSAEQQLPPDTLTWFLDDPFRTWDTTILFIVLFVTLCGCTILLGARYAEIFRFDENYADELPLTLEARQASGQWHDGGDGGDGGDVECLTSGNLLFQATNSQDDHRFDLRRRPGTANLQPNYVAIGKVREGKIAQRRASLLEASGRTKHAHGHLTLKTLPGSGN
ncbi:hypothetical protein AYO20_02464 [Fonsecaea nubica]|uniref:Uncharacterized protein n=1 Tax=Fonsecaea nubica TaxID=856822 RepID=A0A178DBA8_9EURO|nr:hypothetical protein AYO20_02464 [Fonsecaea nubica]OAL38405.1 hypothetical protein AYO20_02464 [Fonsecaea nubica]